MLMCSIGTFVWFWPKNKGLPNANQKQFKSKMVHGLLCFMYFQQSTMRPLDRDIFVPH